MQSNYSLSFTTEPSPISPATAILSNTNFRAAVTLAESGSAFTAASESIPLTLTGTGMTSNGTASTVGGVASYSTLQVTAAGTGDKLTASLAVTNSASVTATSSTFTINAPLYLNASALAFGNEGVGMISVAKTVSLYNYTGATVSPVISLPVGASFAASGCANCLTMPPAAFR